MYFTLIVTMLQLKIDYITNIFQSFIELKS